MKKQPQGSFQEPKINNTANSVGEENQKKKNGKQSQEKSGKKKVLVFMPLTIPATGKSTLFRRIQQQLTEYDVEILSCDQIRAEKIETLMKRQKNLTKMQAQDKINPAAIKQYFKDLGKIMTRIHESKDNDKFVLILDRNHSEAAFQKPIEQIKNSVQKFDDIDAKIICVVPKCQQQAKDGVHSYPFSLSYVAFCILRVVGRDEHQTMEGPQTQRANVCISYANNFRDFKLSNKQLSKYFDGAIRLPFHKQKQLTKQVSNNLLKILSTNTPGRYDENPLVQQLIEDLKKWKDVEQLSTQVDMNEVKLLFENLFDNFQHLKVDVKNFPNQQFLEKSD